MRAVSDGVVIARNVTPGQVVNTGDEAFVTSDLSTVWVSAAVNEKDLPDVHIGRAATVTTQGGNAQGLRGTVSMLGDLVDPQTRTVPVRLTVPNPGTSYSLLTVPGVSEINSWGGETKQYTIEVDPESLRPYNLALHDVMMAVSSNNTNFGGS